MAVSEITIGGKLCQFVKEWGDDHYCMLELLRFFGSHPCARFSRLAIVHALSSTKVYIEGALKHLINKGVVRRYIENNVPFYSLTEDESLRSPVLELAKLDWFQWQLMLRQIYPVTAEQDNPQDQHARAPERIL